MSGTAPLSDAILASRQLRRVFRADCGNGLYATAFFPAGHDIISSTPSAAVVQSTQQKTRCHSCFRSGQTDGDSLRRCAGCKSVWYCNAECQRRHWKDTHRPECTHFARLASVHPTDSIVLMSRFCRSVMRECDATMMAEIVSMLDGHGRDWTSDQQMQFAQMAVLVRDLLGSDPSTGTTLPIDRIVYWFGLLLCNSFNICDDEMRTIGLGFYPVLSWINHSCQPNCVAVFDGSRMIIRAITDIAPETQITISYIEVAQSTAARQTHLREHFFFTCGCERCKSPLDAYLNGYACPLSKESASKCMGMLGVYASGGGFQYLSSAEPFVDSIDAAMHDTESKGLVESLPNICHVCKKHADMVSVQESLLSVRSIYKAAMEKKAKGDTQKLEIKLVELLRKMTSILHCANAELVNMSNEVQTAAIDNQNFEIAFEASQVLLAAHKKIYPGNWPILGLQYFMVGKLAWYLEKTNKALLHFQKAHSILTISHGTSHPLVADLSQRIQEAQAELAYKNPQREK